MKPKTRLENFLAKIAGDASANEAMTPKTPKEYYLNAIAQNGGGGGGGGGSSGGGVLLVTVDFAQADDFDVNLILSATFAELKAAHEAGKEILAQYNNGPLYPLVYQPAGENDGTPYPENFSGMVGALYLQENVSTGNQDLIYAAYDYGVSESQSFAYLYLETTIATQ